MTCCVVAPHCQMLEAGGRELVEHYMAEFEKQHLPQVLTERERKQVEQFARKQMVAMIPDVVERQCHALINCYGQHCRPLVLSTVKGATADQGGSLIYCYGQHRMLVERSN